MSIWSPDEVFSGLRLAPYPQDVLFGLYERRNLWTFKQLVAETRQAGPHTRSLVRLALEPLCPSSHVKHPSKVLKLSRLVQFLNGAGIEWTRGSLQGPGGSQPSS